jgi:hypothetical protein
MEKYYCPKCKTLLLRVGFYLYCWLHNEYFHRGKIKSIKGA